MWELVAATAATACPLYRALSAAMTLLLKSLTFTAISPRLAIRSSATGKSLTVITALTPGNASAFAVLMDLMRAWAWGLRSTLPCNMPVRRISPPYTARPVTLSAPSGRIGRVPMTLYSAVASAIMPSPSRWLHPRQPGQFYRIPYSGTDYQPTSNAPGALSAWDFWLITLWQP